MPVWSSLFSPRPNQGYTTSRDLNSTPAASSRAREETHRGHDQELERQRKINQEIESRLEYCQHDLIRTQERLRRKNELYAQLEAKATASEERYHQQATALCKKINALENDMETVDEEEFIRGWRRLRLNVDHLVKRNFKDIAKIDQLDHKPILESIGAIDSDKEYPLGGSMHQSWAIVQAWIVKILNSSIFSRYHPGFGEYENNFFFEMDRLITEQCSVNTWRHCKLGINLALAHIMGSAQSVLVENIVNHVDHILGAYTSTESSIFQQQLQATVVRCAEFKNRCSQQPQTYRLFSSQPGHIIDSNCMTAAGMIDCSEKIVSLSLWPSLWKETDSGDLYCLESELIWATSV